MPSTSKKQHNFMAAVANNPAFAKKAGVPQSVGQDFLSADKGKKFGSAGTRPDRQRINSPKTDHGGSSLFSKGGEMKESKAMMKKEVAFMQKKGAPKSMIKHEKAEAKMAKGGYTRAADGIASKGKTKAMQPAMKGGKPLGMKKGGYC